MNCPNCSVHIFDNHPNCINCGFALTIMNKPHMNMNHTPGPWLVEEASHFSSLIYTLHDDEGYEGEKMNVLQIYQDGLGLGDVYAAVRKEDAHLIAAAPEMYEALKAIVEGGNNVMDKVEAALNKAEGKLK